MPGIRDARDEVPEEELDMMHKGPSWDRKPEYGDDQELVFDDE